MFSSAEINELATQNPIHIENTLRHKRDIKALLGGGKLKEFVSSRQPKKRLKEVL